MAPRESVTLDGVQTPSPTVGILSITSPKSLERGEKDGRSRPLVTKLAKGVAWTILVLSILYIFMVGIKVMGSSFQVLIGCDAGHLFEFTNNAIAGLMVGVVVTVLVQSSSTSTSIVVTLVGAGAITVDQAVPIIMGANIGTTVTSTLVSMAQIGDRQQFERAFAGATLHDIFNVLSVVILLPLQVATSFISNLASWIVGNGIAQEGTPMFSPLEAVVDPVADFFVEVNKSIIYDAANEEVDCSDVDTMLEGGIFYDVLGDDAAGILLLIISLIMMVGALTLMVKVLNFLLRDSSETLLKKALGWNGYFNIFVGAGITFVVQSSSIVTSVLTPLVGVGAVELVQMYPLVLGANVGTTGTAFLAAMVSGNNDSVEVALCHLIFNVCGIILWYPIPFMRSIPLRWAKTQGWIGARWKLYPVLYLVSMFLIIPAALISLSFMYTSSSALVVGLAIGWTAVLLIGILGVVVWLVLFGGKGKIVTWLSKDDDDVMLGRSGSSIAWSTTIGEYSFLERSSKMRASEEGRPMV